GQPDFRRHAVRELVRARGPARFGSGGDVSQPERYAAQSRRLDGGVSGARVLVGIEHDDRRSEASQHVHAIPDARRFSRRDGLLAPLAGDSRDGRELQPCVRIRTSSPLKPKSCAKRSTAPTIATTSSTIRKFPTPTTTT